MSAEVVHAPHGIEHRRALVGFDTGERRPLGRERSPAGGNHHHLGNKLRARIGDESEAPVLHLLQGIDALAEMERGAEGLDLRHQRIGEALACHDRQPGNVVDRFLRIELGALAAGLVENVDDVRLDIDEAEFEHREQPDRARHR